MTDPGSAAEPRWMVPRGLIVVLAVTGLLVSGMALQQFASILGPVLLALILAIGVHSLDRHPLSTRGADVADGDRHVGRVLRNQLICDLAHGLSQALASIAGPTRSGLAARPSLHQDSNRRLAR